MRRREFLGGLAVGFAVGAVLCRCSERQVYHWAHALRRSPPITLESRGGKILTNVLYSDVSSLVELDL